MRLLSLKNIAYSLLLLSIITLLSCQSIDPKPPTIEQSTATITPTLSSIQLPLIFPIEDFEKLINSKVPDTIYQDVDFGKHKHNNLMLEISKSADIQLSMSGNTLMHRLPLDVKVKVKTKLGLQTNTSFSIVLLLETVLDIDKEWKLITHTQLKKLEWVEKPKIKLGFLKINISKLVEKLLLTHLDPVLVKIDEAIHEQVPLRAEINKVWAGLQKPIRINQKIEPFWLTIAPKEAFLGKINGNQSQLSIQVMLKAFLNIAPNKQKPDIQITELPLLQKIKKQAFNSFHVNIFVQLPFHELNRLLAEQIANKIIPVEDYQLKIKKLLLQGSKDTLILTAKVKGDASGTLHLKGIPAYDSIASTLQIEQFEFDINTENVLVGSADWLLHENVKQQIQQELHLPIEKYIHLLPKLIENGVANSKLGKKLKVHLSDFKLQPKQLLVNNKEVQLMISVEGQLSLDLENLID